MLMMTMKKRKKIKLDKSSYVIIKKQIIRGLFGRFHFYYLKG